MCPDKLDSIKKKEPPWTQVGPAALHNWRRDWCPSWFDFIKYETARRTGGAGAFSFAHRRRASVFALWLSAGPVCDRGCARAGPHFGPPEYPRQTFTWRSRGCALVCSELNASRLRHLICSRFDQAFAMMPRVSQRAISSLSISSLSSSTSSSSSLIRSVMQPMSEQRSVSSSS